MICEEFSERSFESVSKDKFARRRRAAFDMDEKDVTKKDVKTPSSSQRSELHHGVIMIMKSIPFEIGSASCRSYNQAQGWLRVPYIKKRH